VTITSDSLLSLLDIASLFIATLYVILSSCYLSVPYKDSDFSIARRCKTMAVTAARSQRHRTSKDIETTDHIHRNSTQLPKGNSHTSRRQTVPYTKPYNCLSSTCSTTTTHRTTIPRQHAHSITPLDSHRNRTTQLCHQLIMRPQSHLFSAGSEDMTK
jgi:hypothetical protein